MGSEAGAAGGADLAGVLDVDGQLVLQGVDPVEADLAAEAGRDADAGLLAVEVVVEVDQMGLDEEESRSLRRTSAGARC